MAPNNPRIIVVDEHYRLFDIVKAAISLLDRRPRLIHTHTADDAMLELRLTTVDLLITPHMLSGSTNGPMLALMAKRELAALPVIVLAEETDPELDEQTLEEAPFAYMRRPFMPESFIRLLRLALDGPEAVPHEADEETVIVPVPTIDFPKLRPMLFSLMKEVGAMASILADRNGKVLAFEGAAGYVDRDALAAVLGAAFGGVTKIVPILGDEPRVLKYYDGDKIDLFALGLGLHHFIMLVFEGNASSAALGSVRRYGSAMINEMLAIVTPEVAFSLKAISPTHQASEPEQKSAHHKSSHKASAKTATKTSPAVLPEPPAQRRRSRRTLTQEVPLVPSDEPNEEPQPAIDAPTMDPIENFDPSILDSLDQFDSNLADELFSTNSIQEMLNNSTSSNKISYDDALLQGIIGDIEE